MLDPPDRVIEREAEVLKRSRIMTVALQTSLVLGACALGSRAAAQTTPAGWNILKDKQGLCQVAVPPDWSPDMTDPGWAGVKDHLTKGGLVVVASHPNVTMTAMPPEALQELYDIEKMVENTGKRVFYRTNDKQITSYRITVPGETGTCSVQVWIFPDLPKNLAKRIALLIAPVK